MSEGGEGAPVQINSADNVDSAQSEVGESPQDPLAKSQQTLPAPSTQKPILHPNTVKMFGSDAVLESPRKYDDPEQQKKQDTRAFSKSTPEGREARAQAAIEVANLRDNGRLQRAREILQRFYSSQGLKIQDIKERDDLEHYLDEEGHVENLAQMGKYVVHAIKPKGKNWSSPHSPESWQDKLATVVDLKPSVSTSTITSGKNARLWYSFGVVFRSGRVLDASVTDMGTGATELKDRRAPASARVNNINEYQRRINTHNGKNYNEIILGGDPEAAGLFINLDELGALTDGTDEYSPVDERQSRAIGLYAGGAEILKFTDIFKEAHRYGMNVFTFKNGVAHRATLDDGGRLVLGKEISPQEMIEQKYEIPEENKASIHEQAIASLPPEVLQAAA